MRYVFDAMYYIWFRFKSNQMGKVNGFGIVFWVNEMRAVEQRFFSCVFLHFGMNSWYCCWMNNVYSYATGTRKWFKRAFSRQSQTQIVKWYIPGILIFLQKCYRVAGHLTLFFISKIMFLGQAWGWCVWHDGKWISLQKILSEWIIQGVFLF